MYICFLICCWHCYSLSLPPSPIKRLSHINVWLESSGKPFTVTTQLVKKKKKTEAVGTFSAVLINTVYFIYFPNEKGERETQK